MPYGTKAVASRKGVGIAPSAGPDTEFRFDPSHNLVFEIERVGVSGCTAALSEKAFQSLGLLIGEFLEGHVLAPL